MLQPWRNRVALVLHVKFPPANLYRVMPRFDLVLYDRARAQAAGRHLVYFRFADHPPLLSPGPGIEQHDVVAARRGIHGNAHPGRTAANHGEVPRIAAFTDLAEEGVSIH